MKKKVKQKTMGDPCTMLVVMNKAHTERRKDGGGVHYSAGALQRVPTELAESWKDAGLARGPDDPAPSTEPTATPSVSGNVERWVTTPSGKLARKIEYGTKPPSMMRKPRVEVDAPKT